MAVIHIFSNNNTWRYRTLFPEIYYSVYQLTCTPLTSNHIFTPFAIRIPSLQLYYSRKFYWIYSSTFKVSQLCLHICIILNIIYSMNLNCHILTILISLHFLSICAAIPRWCITHPIGLQAALLCAAIPRWCITHPRSPSSSSMCCNQSSRIGWLFILLLAVCRIISGTSIWVLLGAGIWMGLVDNYYEFLKSKC